jgi:hypothetical protein
MIKHSGRTCNSFKTFLLLDRRHASTCYLLQHNLQATAVPTQQRTAYVRMHVFSSMHFCNVSQRLCHVTAACVQQLHVTQSVAFALPSSVISASQRSRCTFVLDHASVRGQTPQIIARMKGKGCRTFEALKVSAAWHNHLFKA